MKDDTVNMTVDPEVPLGQDYSLWCIEVCQKFRKLGMMNVFDAGHLFKAMPRDDDSCKCHLRLGDCGQRQACAGERCWLRRWRSARARQDPSAGPAGDATG